jgi:predicted esterase
METESPSSFAVMCCDRLGDKMTCVLLKCLRRLASGAWLALAAVACSSSDVVRPSSPRPLAGYFASSVALDAPGERAATGPDAAAAEARRRKGRGGSGSDAGLPPLDEGPFIHLDVPRFAPAVVSVSRGATSPRPLIVVAHGAGDRPEWQCEVWRATVGDGGFVLCPRGRPTNVYAPDEETGYFYPTHYALGEEITAAVKALRERFPEHVDFEGPIYAGFSQGAIMGALLIAGHPLGFSRAVLIEGGVGAYEEWNLAAALRFKRAGGERILFACGGPRCEWRARMTAAQFDKVGVEARTLHVEGAGHSYGGQMGQEVRRVFAWVVEGDPRWAGEGGGRVAER